MNNKFLSLAMVLALGAGGLMGCNVAPDTQREKVTLSNRVDDSLMELRQDDPEIRRLIENSAGYAIFPRAGKGGAIIAGGFGRGEVYADGQFIGYATMTQASVGPQIGGQSFDLLLIFQDQEALNRFRNDMWAPSATASAVILRSGAAVTADFQEGVAAFIRPEAGAMAEASLGGKRFKFEPASKRDVNLE